MTVYRQPADATSGPNCGPTSVAVLTAKPLADVLAFIKADCRRGAAWKGSTRNRGRRHGGENSDCYKALAHFGANPKVETGLEDQHRNRQLQNVIADLPGDRAYFVCTGGHAQAVVDGRVFDQSTSIEGDPAATYWGRRKKVNVIISVDRLTAKSNEEDATVTDPALTIVPTDADVPEFVVTVAKFEAEASASVAAIKGLTAEKNGAKVSAYAHIIAGLVSHNVRKGTAQAGDIKVALVTQGVSKACAKRYVENGQKAKVLPWLKAAGSDADGILAAFADNGVKTEQDLVNIVSPKPVLTAAEELAAKAVALTDSDEDAVQALLDAAAAINPGCANVAATLVAALAGASEPLDIAA